MDGMGYLVLGSTAAERWAAMRRLDTNSGPAPWFILVGVAVLLVLIVLLLVVSYRRYLLNRRVERERLTNEITQRGFSTRERQILLAITARSDLRHPHRILAETNAFDLGAARLLAECARTQTAQANETLKGEVARVREKLNLPAVRYAPEPRQVNRRRFPRVVINVSALVARFPFVKSEPIAAGTSLETLAETHRQGGALTFVEGLVTQLAGPGLRVETALRAQPGDRVLVVFRLIDRTVDGVPAMQHTVAAVGRVIRCRNVEHGLSMSLELTDLSAREIGSLVSIGNRLSALPTPVGAARDR